MAFGVLISTVLALLISTIVLACKRDHQITNIKEIIYNNRTDLNNNTIRMTNVETNNNKAEEILLKSRYREEWLKLYENKTDN